MTDTTKKTTVLNLVASFKAGGYRKMVQCGKVFITDKGNSIISLDSAPTLKGNWDGKSYLVMKEDHSDISDIFPVVEGSKGRNLPALEIKAIFDVEQGGKETTKYLECGVAFHGSVRDDDSIKSLVLTLDRLPVGDTGDWDGYTYTGTPVTPRPTAKASRTKKGAAETVED